MNACEILQVWECQVLLCCPLICELSACCYCQIVWYYKMHDLVTMRRSLSRAWLKDHSNLTNTKYNWNFVFCLHRKHCFTIVLEVKRHSIALYVVLWLVVHLFTLLTKNCILNCSSFIPQQILLFFQCTYTLYIDITLTFHIQW